MATCKNDVTQSQTFVQSGLPLLTSLTFRNFVFILHFKCCCCINQTKLFTKESVHCKLQNCYLSISIFHTQLRVERDREKSEFFLLDVLPETLHLPDMIEALILRLVTIFYGTKFKINGQNKFLYEQYVFTALISYNNCSDLKKQFCGSKYIKFCDPYSQLHQNFTSSLSPKLFCQITKAQAVS